MDSKSEMNGGVKSVKKCEESEENKLHRVLSVFLNNVRINNDVYLEMLITHLSGKNKNVEDCTKFIKSPKILEWIERAVDQWATKGLSDHHIVGFTLRLLALYIEEPANFAVVKDKQLLDR
uniref:Uncharacterized protein n=1 Tax=Phlebotomus papatasi TaxID=29031 RepID=A0A1B0DIT0_PHLPP